MKGSVLGKYVGKCCDADVVNNNGMYLSRQLFDKLVASDDYKTAIENGYYIGFLGHPEDPNCMDFKNACIVMTDMQMESNGDITGSFNLVDTPVGRIVNEFRKAGVKFGISIRGAGDVDRDGTVDPDTFVFRGFDLVTFPAYNDCVPEFQEIAASSDVEAQRKYRSVCAAVRNNLSGVTSCEAIDVIKEQFNPNSEEYKLLECRYDEIKDKDDVDAGLLTSEVVKQKVKGLTRAFMDKVKQCEELKAQVSVLSSELANRDRKARRVSDIVACQNVEANGRVADLESECTRLRNKVQSMSVVASRQEADLDELGKKNKELVAASENMRKKFKELEQSNSNLQRENESITRANLLSNKRVEASESLARSKDESINSLKDKLRETVAECESLRRDASNREAEVDNLTSRVEACERLLLEYQQAYADTCAYEAGVSLDSVPVTSSTSVQELRSYIYAQAACGGSHRRNEELTDETNEFDQEANGLVTL